MKYILYIAVVIAAMIMMVSAAPHKQTCQAMTDPHANEVCKEYCGKAGFLLGSCGKSGICICNKKLPAKKVTKKINTKNATKKTHTKKATKKTHTKKATKKTTTATAKLY